MKLNNNLKKIIILGSTGMMGSVISNLLKNDERFQILCFYKNSKKIKFMNLKKNQKKKLNIKNFNELKKTINKFNPHYLINCVGLIKQLFNSKNIKDARYLNSTLPLKLSLIAKKKKFKVIHLSTDCVFKGNKGNYSETHKADAEDYYGISKLKGEIKSKNVLNIRTSIIGHEINSSYSLLNWFLDQKKVKGFKNAFFTGLTTLELSNIIINKIILKNVFLNGLYHISGPKISKLDLLKIIKKIYKTKTIINIDKDFKIDRSLNSIKFRKKVNLNTKKWSMMIRELKNFNENI
tara:strand:- start:1607 stop:2485 length:879 start_codon:yes stop_codon:yes gene_type:complete